MSKNDNKTLRQSSLATFVSGKSNPEKRKASASPENDDEDDFVDRAEVLELLTERFDAQDTIIKKNIELAVTAAITAAYTSVMADTKKTLQAVTDPLLKLVPELENKIVKLQEENAELKKEVDDIRQRLKIMQNDGESRRMQQVITDNKCKVYVADISLLNINGITTVRLMGGKNAKLQDDLCNALAPLAAAAGFKGDGPLLADLFIFHQKPSADVDGAAGAVAIPTPPPPCNLVFQHTNLARWFMSTFHKKGEKNVQPARLRLPGYTEDVQHLHALMFPLKSKKVISHYFVNPRVDRKEGLVVMEVDVFLTDETKVKGIDIHIQRRGFAAKQPADFYKDLGRLPAFSGIDQQLAADLVQLVRLPARPKQRPPLHR